MIFFKKNKIFFILLFTLILISTTLAYNTNIFYILGKERLLILGSNIFKSKDANIYATTSQISHNKVALTFDDGPSTNTLEILDILKEEKVNATFFVVGKNIEKYPEILSRIKKDGHQIANHSYSHSPKLYKQSQKTITYEISTTEDSIVKIVGKVPKYFRPPYGSLSYNMEKVLKDNNYKIVLWDIDPKDWDIKNSPEEVEEAVLKNVKDNYIILLHDSKSPTEGNKITDENTEAILKDLIEKLKKQGYEFVDIETYYNKLKI